MPTSQGWPLRGGYGRLRFFKIVDPYPLDEKGRALELDEAGDLVRVGQPVRQAGASVRILIVRPAAGSSPGPPTI
jgi:hypothetical protein